jgi:hypothetical protein
MKSVPIETATLLQRWAGIPKLIFHWALLGAEGLKSSGDLHHRIEPNQNSVMKKKLLS